MKAYLINMHLLVPRSRSAAKVKVKYKGYISQKMAVLSPLKTLWEKEKLLITSDFAFFHSIFYLFGELFAGFIKFEIVVCKLFQFGRV